MRKVVVTILDEDCLLVDDEVISLLDHEVGHWEILGDLSNFVGKED